MKYDNITRAVFIRRPNRFIAEVDLGGRKETVHVRNTGRCRELLIPGCEVWLTAPGTPGRKTAYDLVAVRKGNGIIFNIDSQAPNQVVKEWLNKKDYSRIVPEYTFGDSRIDFYMEREGGARTERDSNSCRERENGDSAEWDSNSCRERESGAGIERDSNSCREWENSAGIERDSNSCRERENSDNADFCAKQDSNACREGNSGACNERCTEDDIGSGEPERYLMEVKGCTLEINGIGYFPDAPTERGIKHIRELIRAAKAGYHAALAFVIQTDGVNEVRPNTDMHPEFGDAVEEARAAGVKILFFTCHVETDEIVITGKLEG